MHWSNRVMAAAAIYAVILAAAALTVNAALQGIIIHATLKEYPSNDTVEMTVNATFEAGVAALVVESYRSLGTGIEVDDIGLVLNQSRLLTFVDDVNQAVVARVLGETAQGVQGYTAWNARLSEANGSIIISVDYRFEPASTIPVTIRGVLDLYMDPAVPVPYRLVHVKDTLIQYGNETEQRQSRVEADITVEGLQEPADYTVLEGGRVYLVASVVQGGGLKITIDGDRLEASNTGDTPGYVLLVYKSGYAVADQVPFYTLRILAPGEEATVNLPSSHGLPEEALTLGSTGLPGQLLILVAVAIMLAGLALWRLRR